MYLKPMINPRKFMRNWFDKLPLAGRITAWFSILVLIMLTLLAFFTVKITSIIDENEISATLKDKTIQAASRPNTFAPIQNSTFFVSYDEYGNIKRGSHPTDFPANVPLSLYEVSTTSLNGSVYLYTDYPLSNTNAEGWVRGIISLTRLNNRYQSFMLAFFGGVSLFFILISAGGYLLIRRGLKPIRKMTRIAAEIGVSKDLSKRIPPISSSEEMMYLSNTFNYMLDSLEEAAQKESQFISNVSHELRTPIAIIQAESEYAKSFVSSLDEAKESFQQIHEQSKFMTSLVTQLLFLSKLDNLRDIKEETEVVNVSELIESIIKDYKILLSTVKVSLHLEQDAQINGHVLFLKSAITNLLDNALKFGATEILITLSANEKEAIFSITDNGKGIPLENLDKIWDRLYQVDSSRNKSSNSGLGLGLSFVKRIVDLHHGSVHVDSIPNIITTFTIKLPIFRHI